MRNRSFLLLLVCALGVGAAASHQDSRRLVSENLAFFEHLFTTPPTASGVHLRAYLGHIGLSVPEGEVFIRIATEFHKQEAALKDQAAAVLSTRPPDMNATLARIRDQRSRLLVDSGVGVLEALGAPASDRINDYIQRVAAALPRRVAK